MKITSYFYLDVLRLKNNQKNSKNLLTSFHLYGNIHNVKRVVTNTKRNKRRKEKTMTNREFFVSISKGIITDEHIAHAVEAIEKLDARNAARSSKPSKAQLENAPIKQAILDFLASNDEAYTEGQLGEAIGVTHNKAGSLARQLVTEGKLISTEIKLPKVGKRKAYSIAK